MAYDRKKLYEEALVLLDAYSIIYIEELSIELGISKETFYRFYPIGSNEYDELKKRIMKNKTHLKRELREEFKVGSPAEKIALYKLAATSEELQALSGQYIDHTTKGKEIVDNRDTNEILKDVKRLATIIEATKGTGE